MLTFVFVDVLFLGFKTKFEQIFNFCFTESFYCLILHFWLFFWRFGFPQYDGSHRVQAQVRRKREAPLLPRATLVRSQVRQDQEGGRQLLVFRSLPRMEQELGRVGQRNPNPEKQCGKHREKGIKIHFLSVRGHSINTWHFLAYFRPPFYLCRSVTLAWTLRVM